MSLSQKLNPAFADFLLKFPPIELPAVLGENTHHAFSTENEPLSDKMIFDFISDEQDEFTEYVPCFLVGATPEFVSIVWWKASLLVYEYVLATFKIDGTPIARRVIASTKVVGETLHQMVAHISAELVIYIAEGRTIVKDFDPLTTHSYTVQFLPNGEFFQINAALN